MYASGEYREQIRCESGTIDVYDCLFIGIDDSAIFLRGVTKFAIRDSTFTEITSIDSRGGVLSAVSFGNGIITRCCTYRVSASPECHTFYLATGDSLQAEAITITRIPREPPTNNACVFYNIETLSIKLINVSHNDCHDMDHGAGILFGTNENGRAVVSKSIFQNLTCGYGIVWIQNWDKYSFYGDHALSDCIIANCQSTYIDHGMITAYGKTGLIENVISRNNHYSSFIECNAGPFTI